MPEPVRSMYQNVVEFRMPKYWPPLGEMLMWPSEERGAEAIQNTFCSRIHLWMLVGMVS